MGELVPTVHVDETSKISVSKHQFLQVDLHGKENLTMMKCHFFYSIDKIVDFNLFNAKH